MLLSGVSAAIVAVILGGGIFGAVTLAASRRRRDLAVRVALGATTPAICQALVKEFLLPVVTGFVIGSAGFLYAMKWLTALFATTADIGIGGILCGHVFFVHYLDCWSIDTAGARGVSPKHDEFVERVKRRCYVEIGNAVF